MARKLYIGVDDKARRIKRAYIGDPSSFYLTAENFCDHSNLINQGVTFSGTSPSGGSCLYFNGSSRILIPSMAELGSTNWTIDWREYPTVATTGSRFSSSYTTDSGTCGGILLGYSNSRVYASTGADNTNWNLVAGANMFSTTANTWTHWAVVKNGTSLKTYRNGTLYASTTCNGNIGVSSKYYMALGDYRAGDHSYFTGYIDYFRISNHARWTGNFTAPTGKASGVARRIKKIYLGVNGVAKLVAEMKNYNITFDGNGVAASKSILMPTNFLSPNEPVAITMPENTFSRSGYMFKYWCTTADGSGAKYAPGATASVTGDTKFYAQWVKLVTVYWYKTININDAADWVTDAATATGPVSGGPNNGYYLGTDISVSYASGEPHYWSKQSLYWNDQFGSGQTATRSMQVPETANLIVYLANHYNADGGPTCCVYNGTSTSSPVYGGPGETVTWGTPLSGRNSITLWANWKTSGIVIDPFNGWRDTRQSWWDVHVTWG